MSLEPFTGLAGFVTLLEAVLGVVLLAGVVRAYRARRADAAAAPVGGDPVTVLAGPATVLVALSVIAWPLLYLLLQSQVPNWAGVMCIEGVLRVGTGSEGAAGLLPSLVRGVQFTKPAVVFAAGAWFLLHRLDRGTRTASLAPRVLGALAFLAVLAVVDAALEATWLAIPKREQALAAGCCSFHVPTASHGVLAPLLDGLAGGEGRTALTIATVGLLALLLAGTFALSRRFAREGPLPVRTTLALAAAGVLWIPVSSAYAARVAAPALLDRPDSECVYCLLAAVPLSGVAIGLSLLGTFGLGWTATLVVLGRDAQTAAALGALARRSVLASLVGYAGAALLAALARVAG